VDYTDVFLLAKQLKSPSSRTSWTNRRFGPIWSHGLGDATQCHLSAQAGADNALSLRADQVLAMLDRLENALAAGELTMSRVDDSVLRMAAVKAPSPRRGR
jgi:beta-glucosidase-like glycosyl hydrolase